MPAYATPADMLDCYDARDIAALCSDSGVTIPCGELPTNTKLLRMLRFASAEVESALIQGGRYSVLDLEGLTDNSKDKLVRMVCEFAMCYLFERRPSWNVDATTKSREQVNKTLLLMREGSEIFNLAQTILAGQPTVTGPTMASYANMNMIVQRTQHYFPASVGIPLQNLGGGGIPTNRIQE